MANRYAIGFMWAAAVALTGCAAQSGMVVEHLPPQNFNGPATVQQQVYAPAPMVAVTPPPTPIPAQPKSALRPSSKVAVPVEWIPNAHPHQWKWIIIHHSATATGGAAAFDKIHKAKGWDGLGYDFVVGNGTDTRDGQIEVGYRWRDQLVGAHAKTPDNRFNIDGIGICLVGNFDVNHPSAQQLASLEKLVSYLMKTYNIPADRILGHGQTKATDCPGRYVNIAEIKRRSSQMVANSGGLPDALGAAEVASFHDGQELLVPTAGLNR